MIKSSGCIYTLNEFTYITSHYIRGDFIYAAIIPLHNNAWFFTVPVCVDNPYDIGDGSWEFMTLGYEFKYVGKIPHIHSDIFDGVGDD